MLPNANLVSILIRTFNRPVTLAKAVDSVLQQTHRPLEIIIVNDGGETLDPELKELAAKQQVKLHPVNLKTNQGRSNAANIALKQAQGTALMFLDDDDWIAPNHVSKLLPVLQGSSELIAVYSDTACVFSAANPEVLKVFDYEFDSNRLAYENFLPIHSVLFKNNELSQACEFNSQLDTYEDWNFWVQLAAKGLMQRVPGITAWYNSELSGVGFGSESKSFSLDLAKFFKLTVPFYSPEQISVMLFMCRNFDKVAENNKYNESVIARLQEVARLQETEAKSFFGFTKAVVRKLRTLLGLLIKGDFKGIKNKVLINFYRPKKIKIENGISILCTPHTLFVAKLLKKNLEYFGFKVNSVNDQEPISYRSCLYFVICPQLFNRLPKSYVAFQMEQSVSQRWFNKKYAAILKKSIAVLDYSKKNLAYLQDQQLVDFNKLYYLPISNLPADSLVAEPSPNCKKSLVDFDVVFYGDVHNPRRKEFLDSISKQFKTLIVSEVFGDTLYEQLKRAKVLVNIHYYEGALLETTRIYEALSLGLNIVSEASVDQADHAVLNPWVTFTPIGDLDAMLQAIQMQLDKPRSLAELPTDLAKTKFHLGRMLVALGLINPVAVKTLPAVISPQAMQQPLCLSMPESYERHAVFRQKHPDVSIFHGLRFNPSWVGCALSYSYLAKQALSLGNSHLEVWEDDVVLTPAALERWQAAKEVFLSLESTPNQCDLLSGLLADVSSFTQVLGFYEIQGETYVVIDRMISAVCNFYGGKALKYLAEWNPNNHKVDTNTIDRYLERQNLRVLVPLPFIAGHNPEQDSTLWGFQNSQYDTMIAASEAELERKLQCFKKKRIVDGGVG